jgi:hypothetical protein
MVSSCLADVHGRHCCFKMVMIHSSIEKWSLGINILAMLPFAFNASSAVSAATMFRQLRQRLQANIFASLSERVLPVLNVLSGTRRRSFTDANEHEYRRPLLWPEGHVALVYKNDRASGIERVGIENLLILLATRAASRLITGPRYNLDRRSVGAGSGTG